MEPIKIEFTMDQDLRMRLAELQIKKMPLEHLQTFAIDSMKIILMQESQIKALGTQLYIRGLL